MIFGLSFLFPTLKVLWNRTKDSSEDCVDDEEAADIRMGKNWSSARKVLLVVSKFNELKTLLS